MADNFNPGNVSDAPAPGFAWFGKLPCAGDFVSRRMPYSLQQYWDRWCSDGVEALKVGNPSSGWGFWHSTPHWIFLLPVQPGIPVGQVGVLAPSRDRVGRNFPFLVTSPLVADEVGLWLLRASALGFAWSAVISQAQVNSLSIETMDENLEAALLDVLADAQVTGDSEKTVPLGMQPHSALALEIARKFDVHGAMSYWWSVPPAHAEFQVRTFEGSLNGGHFLELCDHRFTHRS